MKTGRFPPPWYAEVTPNCFIVRDHNEQALAYVYFEDEPGRIAVNFAKLPNPSAWGLTGTDSRMSAEQRLAASSANLPVIDHILFDKRAVSPLRANGADR
jgi:hypothetical protein